MEGGTGHRSVGGSAFQEGGTACAKALDIRRFKKDEGGGWQGRDRSGEDEIGEVSRGCNPAWPGG